MEEIMTTKTRDQHLFGPGPKRILALDGGGIRGILTVQILKKIEAIVRERLGNPSATLSDYFDLIGGTSTGAIIAAGLSLGWTTDRVDRLYKQLGDSIFESSLFSWGAFRPKFSAEPLREALKGEFGDTRLGDDDLRTGLAVMAKRLDTGSPWVLHNNPRGKYFHQRPGSNAVPNKDYLLRDVVRASTAAPHYFEPEEIQVTTNLTGAFVDGGVSPHNNPALQLFMLATLEGYGLDWSTGANRILLVSLGTGSAELKLETKEVMDMKALILAGRSLATLMDDASALNELVLQWLSRSPTARLIDREVGDLSNDVLGGGSPWLTYLRYESWLDSDWLRRVLRLDYTDSQLEALLAMDKPENMEDLIRIGEAAGEFLVEPRHFGSEFDV